MSRDDKATEIARREFLRGAIRYTSLGAIATTVALLSRKQSQTSGSAPCVRDFICGRCPLVPQCALPQATDFRENHREIQL
jgi:hypothetical protein